jgi:tetratricopeptide (TPR) repeat protein
MRQRLPEKFREQLTRSIEEYAQSQYVNAERPESHLNLGLIAVAVGDLQQAEKAYKTALRLDSGFSPAYVNLADLYRQQQRDRDGERVLRTGIESGADNADLQYALGLLLVREKRLNESLPHLRQAAESSPELARYAYVYALALQGAGEQTQAIGILEKAAIRHPADRDTLVALTTLHRDRGDLPAASRYADQLVKHYPGDAQARALRAEFDHE